MQALDSSIPFFPGGTGIGLASLLEQVIEIAAFCLEVGQELLPVSILYLEMVLEGLSRASGKLSFGHGRIVEDEQENYSRRLESNSQFL